MRTILRAPVLGVLVAVFAVSPALAQPVPLALTMDPTSGPIGTVVTFTPVDNCPVVSGYVEEATLALSADAPSNEVLDSSPIDGSGAWSLSYTIPAGTPLGPITFHVECRGVFIGVLEGGPDGSDGSVVPAGRRSFFGTIAPTKLASYAPATFTVTAPATTTTTSTSTTSTTVGSTTTTAVPPAMSTVPSFMYPGESCQLSAHGFKPGSLVEGVVHSTPLSLGTFVADAQGRIAAVWVVPTDFETGNHQIVLTGTTIGGEILSMSGQVTIGARVAAAPTTAAVVPVATGPLPTTGSTIQPMLVLSGTLVVVGGVVLTASRRRRSLR